MRNSSVALADLAQVAIEHVIHDKNTEYDKVIEVKRVTSITVPYKITDVAYFVNDNPRAKSKLTVAMAPGKKDAYWNRDLLEDLKCIKKCDINVIVCLLEWSEMRILGISEYPKLARDNGLTFYHLPIRDRGYPTASELHILIPTITAKLLFGQNVLIHCSAGLGRAGTISACCLTYFGFTSEEAISTVRKRRQGAIQTEKQEGCIHDYEKNIKQIRGK
jgi:protein-tyrosine phosphatase